MLEQTKTLTEQVMEWVRQLRTAQYWDERWREVPWWQVFERRELRRIATEQQEFAAAAEASLPADYLSKLVRDLVCTEWRSQAGQLSTKHPLHPSLTVARRRAVPAIIAAVRDKQLHDFSGFVSEPMTPAEIPGLLEALNAAAVDRILTEQAEYVNGRASDPVMLHASYSPEPGVVRTVVQHKATGMRATFIVRDREAGIGHVFAKPYRIRSIDPDDPHPDGGYDWEVFAGLGVGARVYLEAARLLPGIRWCDGTMRAPAADLRKRLHLTDPYTWAGSCEWCRANGISWESASQDAFAGHPAAGLAT